MIKAILQAIAGVIVVPAAMCGIAHLIPRITPYSEEITFMSLVCSVLIGGLWILAAYENAEKK